MSENPQTNLPENALQIPPVPIQLAALETLAWREFNASIAPLPEDRVNGYFIPVDDINSILNYVQKGVRVYFALRDSGTSAQANLHLYIVPVDANGNDKLTDQQGNSLVYDTTMPCPSLCGAPNALNGCQ